MGETEGRQRAERGDRMGGTEERERGEWERGDRGGEIEGREREERGE